MSSKGERFKNKRFWKWYVIIGNTLLISFLVLFLLFAAFMGVANAGARTYGADKLAKDKQLVTCRLAKKKIVKDQKICLFRGPNNTTDTVFIDRFELCPRTIKCIYEPNKSTPMIQEMMKSIEESLKSRQ